MVKLEKHFYCGFLTNALPMCHMRVTRKLSRQQYDDSPLQNLLQISGSQVTLNKEKEQRRKLNKRCVHTS